MTTIIKIIIVTTISLIFTSCTEVIDVEVPEAEPRLVIEASLDWEKGTIGNIQTITLSLSTPYFNEVTFKAVTGASVRVIKDNDGTAFVFNDQNNGEYTTTTFIPELNETYTLFVDYNGEIFSAKETLMSVSDIEDVYQTREKGFDDEALEVNLDFIDPADEENYYFIKVKAQDNLLPILADLSDEFTNGNLLNVFYERLEDTDINQVEFAPGDIVDIKFYGVSEAYYNYIQLLIEQYESVGDPFSSTPVTLKGNCIGVTNPDNYAFGYFRLTEVVKTRYTFQ